MWRVLAMLCLMLWAMPAIAIDSVTVIADKSLAVPLTQIAREYAKEHHVSVSTAYVSDNEQLEQIAGGAAADLLITLRTSIIDSLKLQGMVDIYSQTIIAKNRLVLAAPFALQTDIELSQGTIPIPKMIQATGGEMRFYIGNAETLPEGVFAMESLRRMQALSDIEPYMTSVKQSADLNQAVENGGFGALFYTDVLQNKNLRVVDFFPEAVHSPALYQAVVVAGENMDGARRFLEYLKSRDAQRIIDLAGFIVD